MLANRHSCSIYLTGIFNIDYSFTKHIRHSYKYLCSESLCKRNRNGNLAVTEENCKHTIALSSRSWVCGGGWRLRFCFKCQASQVECNLATSRIDLVSPTWLRGPTELRPEAKVLMGNFSQISFLILLSNPNQPHAPGFPPSKSYISESSKTEGENL